MKDDPSETLFYPDPGIATKDEPVPRWLWFVYFSLPIWGAFTFYMYWNGSHGFLDRGYWGELQKAANTTSPPINYLELEADKERKTEINQAIQRNK